MLDVGHDRGDRPERRRIERSAHESKRERAADAAADLESSRGDVLVRDSVACCVKSEAEQDGAQPGTDQNPAGCAGGDVHGDDHEAEPTGSGCVARR